MSNQEITCKHQKPMSECKECYPLFLRESTVGDVLDGTTTKINFINPPLISRIRAAMQCMKGKGVLFNVSLEPIGIGILNTYVPYERDDPRGIQCVYVSQIDGNGMNVNVVTPSERIHLEAVKRSEPAK